jgi:outer membrane protein TolC
MTPVNRGEAMERALQSRPELEIARATVDRSQIEHAFARNNIWPSLDAVFSYERFGIAGSANSAASTITGSPIIINSSFDGSWGRSWDQIADGDFDDVRAGLVFSYPIGNGPALAAEDAARHIARQSEAELTRTRKSVRADVLNAVAALETAGQRMEAARAGREAADIQLKAEEDRYGVGLSTNFLVLTRQNDLSRARLNEIAARADYRIARVEYARATGMLLERHDIQHHSPRD